MNEPGLGLPVWWKENQAEEEEEEEGEQEEQEQEEQEQEENGGWNNKQLAATVNLWSMCAFVFAMQINLPFSF